MRSHIRRSGDDGATLIVVLIIVTVVAVVMIAVLGYATTNIRATVALRSVTATNYAADAAANAFLTQLTSTSAAPGHIDCEDEGGTSISLGSSSAAFYVPANTEDGPLNAAVTCTPDIDPDDGAVTETSGSGTVIGPTNTPTAALITVGQNYPTENGVDIDGNWALCIQNGGVLSNSTITGKISAGVSDPVSTSACPTVAKAGITVTAYGAPAPPASGCLSGQYSPTPCTALASPVAVPAVPAPTFPITAANTNQAAVCQKSGSTYYAAFLPGKYTRLTSSTTYSLSTPCKNGSRWVAANVAWFTPGTYYFDFGATSWAVPTTVIGGTPTAPSGTAIAGLNGTNAATLAASTLSNLSQATSFPGACISPTVQSDNGGVEFVFGGASTITMPSGGHMDICAQYVDANTVPIAVYGVYQNQLNVGGGSVSPQSGCVATPGCSGNNSLFVAASPNGHGSFHFEGYVWAPAAAFIMTYKNSAGQSFNWGIVVRTFQVTGNGSSPDEAVISLPKSSFGPVTTTTYAYRYINVWTCPQTLGSCPEAGPPDLRLKVQYSAGSGAVKILSWSRSR
jgi:hypothetical protein